MVHDDLDRLDVEQALHACLVQCIYEFVADVSVSEDVWHVDVLQLHRVT